jgi:hypothetical protein
MILSITLVCCLLLAFSVPAAFGFCPIPAIRSPTYRLPNIALQSKRAFEFRLAISSELESRDSEDHNHTIRSRIRQETGFSFTTLRRTMRAATGISLTAIYASSLAVTGAWIRQSMRAFLSLIPPWARYFVQPFLVLYYAPLFVVRNWTRRSTRGRALRSHEAFVRGLKLAVTAADAKVNYWPLHLDKDGNFEKDFVEVDLNESLAQSVEIQREMEDNDTARVIAV